jgi:hypothetical protein
VAGSTVFDGIVVDGAETGTNLNVRIQGNRIGTTADGLRLLEGLAPIL